jgi:guanylate kinase
MHSTTPQLGTCVSHTTRAPRDGEVDGTHYHFTTHETIKADIDKELFIEHAHVHGNIYGTSIASVAAMANQGKICVLEVDYQGASEIVRKDLKPHLLFIHPPSLDVLRERLTSRGTETPEQVDLRMTNAETEEQFANAEPPFFHKKLVNDDLAEAAVKFQNILLDWYPHLSDCDATKDDDESDDDDGSKELGDGSKEKVGDGAK